MLFVWLGLRTLRNGHGWMFFLGIFFPILWIFGAFAGLVTLNRASPDNELFDGVPGTMLAALHVYEATGADS